jgi:hypothetical protein
MPFTVLLTDDAVRDLEDLTDYIDRHDVPGNCDGLPKTAPTMR